MTDTATGVREAPVVSLDPYAMDVLEDPIPFYRELLDAGPVVYFEKYGVYGVGRYAELREVVTDYFPSSGTGQVNVIFPVQ